MRRDIPVQTAATLSQLNCHVQMMKVFNLDQTIPSKILEQTSARNIRRILKASISSQLKLNGSF